MTDAENTEHTQTTGNVQDTPSGTGEPVTQNITEDVTQQQRYDERAPYSQQAQQTEQTQQTEQAQQTEWSIDVVPNSRLDEWHGAPGAVVQPNVQGAKQPTDTFPRSNAGPGNEDDPAGTNVVPPVMTGEQRWVNAQVGALDSEGGKDWTEQVGTVTGPGTPGLVSQSGGETGQGEWPPVAQDENQYTNPQYAGIQGNMMGSNPIVQGEPFEQGVPPNQPPKTPGNDGFVEGGVEGPPTEAYGQGKTRQFAGLGADPGIVQQEALQSQQYHREERRSRQGMLGVAADMLGRLFGNGKRTPVPPPAADEGEAAGEAHP